MVHFYGWSSTASRLQTHYEQAVYYLQLRYGLYRLILTLSYQVVPKGHICYLNKPGTLSIMSSCYHQAFKSYQGSTNAYNLLYVVAEALYNLGIHIRLDTLFLNRFES